MVTLEQIWARLDRIEMLIQHNASEIMTVEDAAFMCGLSKSSIYHLTSERKMPHYKQNSKLYFRRSELVEWLLSNKVPTIEERLKDYEK